MFNGLRNISLVLVLLAVSLPIVEKHLPSRPPEPLAKAVEEFADEHNDATLSGVTPPVDKLRIKLRGGTAYLRAEEIKYVNSGTPLEIITVTNDTLEATLRLRELEEMLETSGGPFFFKIRTAIINCEYIQQLVKREISPERNRYYYQNYIILQGGVEFPLSSAKAKELDRRMQGQDS